MLFDADIPRTDTAPARYGEPRFAYLNRTARSDAAAVRVVLDEWHAEYPQAAQLELRNRFRSCDTYPHYAAFFELYVHELLRRTGLSVTIPEPVPGAAVSRAPDFLAQSATGSSFFVEATLATNLSRDEMAAEARLSQVYDSLNNLNSPNFFVGVEVDGAPDRPVPGRPLRKAVEKFLATLDPDECVDLIRKHGLGALPELPFEHDGWRIVISPIPKSVTARGQPDIRPLGMTGDMNVRIVDDSVAVKDAVVVKAGHYGDLGRQFVVAVDAVNQHLDTTDLMESLFGKESYTIPVVGGRRGEPRMSRLPDGAWIGPKGPTNTRVSAVIVGSSIIPWSVAAYTPVVYHNPFARYPLEAELDVLPHHRAEANRMIAHEGRSAREIFGLPLVWPGSEDVGAV